MPLTDELFEAQAERTPDAVAVVFEGSNLTYCELNRRADGLAKQLRALGVGPDVLVALFLDRSLDMVVGMLGVLKAGGAYVPLDPTHPPKRLAYMLADAQPLVLLTQQRLQSELPPHSSRVVVIDGAPPAAPLERNSAPGRARSPRDLAYVIYTSGSTGEPKGVEIEHRAVVNMLASMQRRPGLGAEDRMLAITTLTFDIAALEIFLPLACGARIVIAASETIRDGEALTSLIGRSGVSVMQATPATLRMLLDVGWTGALRLKVLCGGEAWSAEFASQLLSRCGSLWNMYGPTETTVWSAVNKVEADHPIVIGRPIANTRFYVLDGALQLVPVGVPGELHIGGDGLARGYLHRPELTRERFVTDPFAAEPGARIYRTGDLVRRLPDGTLEFLGRLDHQVKIRGHRIELGEIEARLVDYPGLREAVVLAREDRPGDKRLAAYFVGEADISAAALRTHLANALPEYMVPTAFVRLDALPLTSNGKLDRNGLPLPDASAQGTDATSLQPRTSAEEVLARIWREMLDLKKVGVRDNFFELGGHSLMAVRVIARINETLDVKLGVIDLFSNPTIEALAASVERENFAQARLRQKIEALSEAEVEAELARLGGGS
jgi:amino acid adenylation domain-containing protein